jgi:membrane protein insertase Oxa1/YidC/SpoIIIJ
MPPQPQSAATPPAASSPSQRRQRNVGLWIVAGVWLFFILMFALGVVVYLSLR